VRCRSEADTPLTVDQRNQPRPLGNGCDAGSFEHKPVVLTLSGPSSVSEDVGSALITASLLEAAPVPVVVFMSTEDAGSATADSDYTAFAAKVFTIPAESSSASFMIDVIDDTIDEFSETFTVTLQTPINGATINGPTQFMISIEDNDDPPALSIADTSNLETSTSGEMVFDVTLDNANGSEKHISFDYVSIEGDATGGADFSMSTDTLMINPGEVSQQIRIRIIPDTQQESDETFTVQISNPVNATIADDTATGTIIDDDAPTIIYIPIVTR
jgi:hypothetical protein